MENKLPSALYKFCTLETAIKILDGGCLRWSAPQCFHDPFELTRQTTLGFTHEQLVEAVVKMSVAMIFGKDDPKGNTPIINALKRWRDEKRFTSQEEAQEVLTGLATQMATPHKDVTDKIAADWTSFASTIRICCFSEKIDNIQSWRHFADNHQGVALRFSCGEGTGLTKPYKVAYKNEKPSVSAVKDHIAAILYNTRVEPQDNFLQKFILKSNDYKLDNEWRCFSKAEDKISPDGAADQMWSDDKNFETQELTGLYFGLNTTDNSKAELKKLLANRSPKAKCFQAEISDKGYELEFISTGASTQ